MFISCSVFANSIILPPIVLLDVAWTDLVKMLRRGDNSIGDLGAGKLAEALPHLKNLTVAWLGSPPLLCVNQHRGTMCYARIALAV